MIKIVYDTDGKACELYETVAKAAFEKLNLSGDAWVELLIVDRDEIKAVNAEKRGVDSVTDVLSFPMLDEILPFDRAHYPYDYDELMESVTLGSIMICDEVARAQAEEYGHAVERERAYLFLHGLLHLLGYDHIDEDDRRTMRTAEESVLSAIGITR